MGGYLLSAAWLLCTGVCLAFTCRRIGDRLVPAGEGVLRLLAWLVVAWAQVAGVLLLLGAVHALYPGSVLAAEAVVAVACARFLPPGRALARPRLGWPALLTIGAVAAVIAYWAAYSVGAPSAEFDSNRYHIVNVAHWLSSHETWSLPFAQPSDHTALEPGNGEIVSLWLMLPFGDDRLAYTTNLAAALLLAVAAAALVRELGGRAWTGGVAALSILLSTFVATAFPHSILTDLWAVGGIAAAVALGLAASRLGLGRLWALAGVAAGLSAGTKYADLVPAAATLVVLLVAARAPRRSALLAAGGAAAAAGFWYVRNALITGDPVYPQGLHVGGHAILGGDDGPVSTPSVSFVGQLLRGQSSILTVERDVLLTSALPVVLLVLAAVCMLVAQRVAPRLRPDTAFSRRGRVLVIAVVCALAQMLTPYSGGGDPPQPLYVNGALRYLLPALVLAAVLSVTVVPPLVSVAAVAVGTVVRADLLVQGDPTRTDLAFHAWAPVLAVGCAVIAVVVAARPVALRRRREGWLLAPAAAAALAVAGTAGATGGGLLQPVLARSSAAGCGCVVLVNVGDVRDVLAPGFTLPIRSAGSGGPEGARHEILDPAQLLSSIESMRPAVVIVGDDASTMPKAPLAPPSSWLVLGHVGGGIAYVPG